MSTLAAARADNFYFGPDFDPKKGGLNKQQGQHPLRERAKKLEHGILVIRFEMPFNVWCQGCGHLIGKGVRFNAEKQQIGNYHSTKIWAFVMHAPCCHQRIEVHTDPKNAEYVIVSGARRKVEDYNPSDAEVIELMDQHDRSKLDDPFFKLEDTKKKTELKVQHDERLAELRADSFVKYKDDYAMNKELRKRMRVERNAEKERDNKRRQMGLPEQVKLLPERESDKQLAALIQYGKGEGAWKQNWQKSRKAIVSSPIFSSEAVAAAQKRRQSETKRHRRSI
jgi:coiled-coil domain-containing protein 130